MKPFPNATATAAVLAAFILVTSAASVTAMAADADGRVQLAHGMDQGTRGGAAPGGMMGPGMMGPGMMGWGMGPGMMGPGFGGRIVAPAKDLSAKDVRHFLEHRLAWQGNKRVKLGEVKEVDDHAILADIVTVDGSLVQRLKVDRHTGQMQQAE